MKNQVAFLDEFGNNGLDFSKDGVSTHFIVVAIILDKNDVPKIEQDLEIIRSRHFQSGEIKSSKIGNNDRRRKKFLLELIKLDFHFFAIVVDKRQLKSEGFNYKESFYKFLNGLIDRELYKTFPNLKISADQHGTNKYMSSFVKYIHNRHIPTLFTKSGFRFSDSKSTIIIQAADIIAGTLGRCYDEVKKSEKAPEFLEILKEKSLGIRFWPSNYVPYTYDPGKDFSEFDEMIAELGLNLSYQFIEERKKSRVPAVIRHVLV